MSMINFPPPQETATLDALRREVRAFLHAELAGMTPLQRARSWAVHDRAFSRKLAAKGWIGMTWPRRYGGHERSALERYVVLEELLAAGAPVGAHWVADRQSGPLLLRYGSEEQRQAIIPRIALGECCICIGMSEPDSGSDLAAARTRATPADGGYRINGTKLWTSHAHHADYILLFCRTGQSEDRHGGTSQFLVPLDTPGITVRPVIDMAGDHHFNEVVLEDAFVPASCLIGKEGDGWHQVTSELAFERSGPDRFLSCFALLVELVRLAEHDPSPRALAAVGRLTAHLMVLRRMSRSVATLLQAGENPTLQASIVKDVGTAFEQEIPEIARTLATVEPSLSAAEDLPAVVACLTLSAPSFTLRGGTREILRGIIARGLGLR